MTKINSQRLSVSDDPLVPLMVRVKEACRLTGIGRSKPYLLMKEGVIVRVKVGSLTLIPMSSLEKLANDDQA